MVIDIDVDYYRNELRDYIKFRKVSLVDLEPKIKVSYQTIRNFLNNKKVSRHTIIRIRSFIEGE